MTGLSRASSLGQLVRFLAVGGTNTILTGAIFLVLTGFVAPSAAFTVAFVTGVVFAMVVTPRAVFAGPATRKRRALYAAWYVVIYFVGLAVVYLTGDVLRLNRLAIVAASIAVSALLGFLGARRLFHEASDQAAPGVRKHG